MNLVSSIFSLIPHIIVLVAVILYVNKFASPEGIMMLIGAIIEIFTSLFYSFVLPNWGSEGYEIMQPYFTVVGIITSLGFLSFAIGFLLAVQKLLADKR